jgi:hypothetical protein
MELSYRSRLMGPPAGFIIGCVIGSAGRGRPACDVLTLPHFEFMNALGLRHTVANLPASSRAHMGRARAGPRRGRNLAPVAMGRRVGGGSSELNPASRPGVSSVLSACMTLRTSGRSDRLAQSRRRRPTVPTLPCWTPRPPAAPSNRQRARIRCATPRSRVSQGDEPRRRSAGAGLLPPTYHQLDPTRTGRAAATLTATATRKGAML